MKILIIGGKGTIGKTVVQGLEKEHEVLIASRNDHLYPVDIADSSSIEGLLEKIGKIDAIVNIAGEAKWAPFDSLSEDDYYIGIRSKLMGQVNLTRIGIKYLNRGGSITLSTGILADDPVQMTASAAMVNGAIHSFVQAASLELTGQCRLNVVSLGLVEDSAEKYREYFPGHVPVSMTKALKAYERGVLGSDHGRVIRVYE